MSPGLDNSALPVPTRVHNKFLHVISQIDPGRRVHMEIVDGSAAQLRITTNPVRDLHSTRGERPRKIFWVRNSLRPERHDRVHVSRDDGVPPPTRSPPVPAGTTAANSAKVATKRPGESEHEVHHHQGESSGDRLIVSTCGALEI